MSRASLVGLRRNPGEGAGIGSGAVDRQPAGHANGDASGIPAPKGAGPHRAVGKDRQRPRLAVGYVDRYGSGAPGAKSGAKGGARNITARNRQATRGDGDISTTSGSFSRAGDQTGVSGGQGPRGDNYLARVPGARWQGVRGSERTARDYTAVDDRECPSFDGHVTGIPRAPGLRVCNNADRGCRRSVDRQLTVNRDRDVAPFARSEGVAHDRAVAGDRQSPGSHGDNSTRSASERIARDQTAVDKGQAPGADCDPACISYAARVGLRRNPRQGAGIAPGAVDYQTAGHMHRDVPGIAGARGAGGHRTIGKDHQRPRLAAGYFDRYGSASSRSKRAARD